MLVECKACEALVDGQLIAEYEHFDAESLTQAKYSFVKCPKCASPFIMLNVNYVDDNDGWGEPRRLYPPIETGISVAIPNTLRLVYGEAHTCFKAKAYTATAIMCRKTLEESLMKTKLPHAIL